MIELEKYKKIYSNDEYSFYGHTNHGSEAYELISVMCPESIVDVGCGHNEFCIYFSQNEVKSVGVDFACPSSNVIADAVNLPFKNKSFDILTSFDMLEHLLPKDISSVLDEFKRISKRYVFSISYVPSKILVEGENLHPSVFSKDWWVSELQKRSITICYQKYIFGKWV